MRFLALLMLVAQLGTFAAPALATSPDRHTHDVCGTVASPTASVEAQRGADCEACEMAECGSMLGCAAVSPALAAQNAGILVCPVVPEPAAEAADHEIELQALPTSPPPKP